MSIVFKCALPVLIAFFAPIVLTGCSERQDPSDKQRKSPTPAPDSHLVDEGPAPYLGRRGKSSGLYFEGQINRKALSLFTDAERNGSLRTGGTLLLNSPGGDVNAAMEIGRVIRRFEMYVEVPNDGICASSCVLLYAAGTTRSFFRESGIGNGPIVIHRPFFPDAHGASMPDVQSSYDRVARMVKLYLGSMNVRTELWDEMMRIPSHSGLALTAAQLDEFGMGTVDPAQAELNAQREAARFGLPREVYNQRVQVANQSCSPLDGKCRDRVLSTGSL